MAGSAPGTVQQDSTIGPHPDPTFEALLGLSHETKGHHPEITDGETEAGQWQSTDPRIPTKDLTPSSPFSRTLDPIVQV